MAWWMGLGAEIVGWVTGVEGSLNRGVIDDTCRDRYCSIIKARRVLGYRPRVGLEEGIRRSCEWYKGVVGGRKVHKERDGWS
jgi:sterol-4alpha-carboxylate 3-dehydrogenase (decarboxylating)